MPQLLFPPYLSRVVKTLPDYHVDDCPGQDQVAKQVPLHPPNLIYSPTHVEHLIAAQEHTARLRQELHLLPELLHRRLAVVLGDTMQEGHRLVEGNPVVRVPALVIGPCSIW